MPSSAGYRTLLFVPGDRPDRIASAHARGADVVVVDLEDAVAVSEKERIRASVMEQLARGQPAGPTMVRVNARGTPWFDGDLAALAPVLDRLAGILLPKVSSADDVRAAEAELSAPVPLLPLIETASGVLEAHAIAAASEQVHMLMFGSADLSAELGVTPTPDGIELLHARSHVVLASAAVGIRAPLDGPYLRLGDPDGLAVATRAARLLGFGGKGVIHPEQIAAVHEEFTVSPSQSEWATEVTAALEAAIAAGSGVARLGDGTFVDEPIARRARMLLDTIGGQR